MTEPTPFTYAQAMAIHRYGDAMAEIGAAMVTYHHAQTRNNLSNWETANDVADQRFKELLASFDARWPTAGEQMQENGLI